MVSPLHRAAAYAVPVFGHFGVGFDKAISFFWNCLRVFLCGGYFPNVAVGLCSLKTLASFLYQLIIDFFTHPRETVTLDLQETIDRFRGPLVGLVISWGVPAVDAVEIAQDSLADAYLSRDSCRADVSDPKIFGRWLRGVAKNKFRNWMRGRSRRERLVKTVGDDVLDQVAAEAIVEDSRLVQLRSEIQGLPTNYKQVVMMHYLESTSVADIAALLSITPKAVESRLYQARRTLRKRMDDPTSWELVAKAILL